LILIILFLSVAVIFFIVYDSSNNIELGIHRPNYVFKDKTKYINYAIVFLFCCSLIFFKDLN